MGTDKKFSVKNLSDSTSRLRFLTMRLALTLLSRHLPNQTQWISRTVMVNNNDVDTAMTALNGIMASEGLMQRWKLTRRYEKPFQTRQRINYERCRAIYNEDMQNRIKFIMKKNGKAPHPAV